MSFYPKNWPKCPVCGEDALDEHITCGSFQCNEGERRRERADRHAEERMKMFSRLYSKSE